MAEVDDARDDLRSCTVCGAPTPGDICAFCRMRARAVGAPIGVRSVSIGTGGGDT
jgi:recombinational DNA repair protein RecR